MDVRYVNKISVRNMNALYVHVYNNAQEYHAFLSSHKLSTADAGTKIIMNGHRLFVFLLDSKFLIASASDLANRLSLYEDDILLDLTHININDKLMIAQQVCKKLYKFHKYKTQQHPFQPRKVFFFDANPQNATLLKDAAHQITITNINRDFQNEPANIITPSTFCEEVRRLFKGQKHVKIRVFDEHDLSRMGLNMILEMGKASVHKSRFMVVEYIPPDNHQKTFAIVGKGVCYDSGGLNLKLGNHMDPSMKTDKTGGTTAVSIVLYAAQAKLKCNIVALVPLIENVISGDVLHPGDIIKTYNQKTVEITNTDAEGRVIMTNALNYTVNYPTITYLFDLATLTGQAETFVPDVTAVHFTMNKKLSEAIIDVGEKVGERTFGLPVYPEYTKATFSDVADYKNYGFKQYSKNSTYMASVYLLNFVQKHLQKNYVHFEIANNFNQNVSNGNAKLLLINVIKNILQRNK